MTVPSAARRRPPGRYDPPPVLGQRVLAVLLTLLLLGCRADTSAEVSHLPAPRHPEHV